MEISKEVLRKCKTLCVERLKQIDVPSYDLDEIDSRLNVYAHALIDDPEAHNLFELLALLRFFRLLDTYCFNTGIVRSFFCFYEMLKFTGVNGPSRYKLTPVQCFQFANVLGFYLDEEKRLIRNALMMVPRKYSKTTQVASFAIWDMLFGDNNSEAYTGANSYEQAQICFKEIKAVMKRLDKKLKNFKTKRERISFKETKGNRPDARTSFIRCLANNADALDGLNASTVIMDEYSQADNADLYNVLTTSMGIRTNPLIVVITTASDKNEGPFVTMLDADKVMLLTELTLGEGAPTTLELFGADFTPIDNDRIFAHIFQPDVDDEESDPKTWAKVQPHMGITVKQDFYEIMYKNALSSADDMKAFRTKLLNIFVSGNERPWLTGSEMKKHAVRLDIDTQGQLPCMVAMDLSIKDDFSAVTYALYYGGTFPQGNGYGFHFHTDYYFPEGCLKDHPNRQLYENWAKLGYLKLTKGNVIDYRQIVDDILEHNNHIKILQIGYDPYKSKDCVNMLSASGAKGVLTPVKQTYSEFTAPVESFELATRTNALTINANPINYYCFDNAILDEDRLENTKPTKRSKNKKIDGVITKLMALKEFNSYIRH